MGRRRKKGKEKRRRQSRKGEGMKERRARQMGSLRWWRKEIRVGKPGRERRTQKNRSGDERASVDEVKGGSQLGCRPLLSRYKCLEGEDIQADGGVVPRAKHSQGSPTGLGSPPGREAGRALLFIGHGRGLVAKSQCSLDSLKWSGCACHMSSALHTESLKGVCVSPVQLPAKPLSSGAQAPPEVQRGDECICRAGGFRGGIPATLVACPRATPFTPVTLCMWLACTVPVAWPEPSLA